MPVELDSRDASFAAAFEALVSARREADEDVRKEWERAFSYRRDDLNDILSREGEREVA